MAQGRREVLLCPGYVVGAPVIALDNTAFPEFESGVACLLPAANVKTLVEGMARVLGDPELCRSIGDAGPHRAGSYDWRLITRRYLNLIVPLAREWEAA